MQVLPKWVLANRLPSIYDFESLSATDQTARIYGAMNSLIEEYNKFADTVNEQLSTFTESEQEKREDFELKITKVIREFICNFNHTFDSSIIRMFNDAIAEGKITIKEVYNPETESLDMVLGGEL